MIQQRLLISHQLEAAEAASCFKNCITEEADG